MVLATIRKSLSLKISIALAVVTSVATAAVGSVIISNETSLLEELTLNKAKTSAQLGAHNYGLSLEGAVDNNYLTVDEVFDTNYVEIKGFNWGGKPKYHTRYDAYTDQAVQGMLDRIVDDPDYISAIGQDTKGYIPTHNARWTKPITGDPQKDIPGNRAKRVQSFDVSLKASQNEQNILIQDYQRDDGSPAWDVSSPIYVKGKHWGAFRIVVSKEQIEKARHSLVVQLGGMFTALALLSAALIFFLVRRSVKPLVQLTNLAEEMSMGEGLENPVPVTSEDEIGLMAKAVDRLRSSLKAAMSRLGE